MEPLEGLENLARIARQEVAPETDVRISAVLRAAAPERSPWRIAPLAWSAAVSAAAALIVLAMALRQTRSGASVDSITPMFNATEVQLPQ